MLSQELRPISFDEVAGQKENIKILKAIIKKPENSPKSLIFQGQFGTGKTTCSRIMARELNNIKDRDYDILNSPYYYEFDSTVVGNVEEIRKLRDTFSISYGDGWRVIVFDEVHACSQASQTALLKILEEVKGRNFFILATTHAHKLLPTIRSRSLELEFECVSEEDIIVNLARVEKEKNISIPGIIKLIIARRSKGHMRNAHMLVDKFLLLGEEDFKESIKSSVDLYASFLTGTYNNDEGVVLESINSLMNIPKDELQSDFYHFMTESMRCMCSFGTKDECIRKVVGLYGADFNLVVRCYFSEWFRVAFIDMPYFQASMLQMYCQIKNDLVKVRNQRNILVNQKVTSNNGNVMVDRRIIR